jgi:hypothetical protein
MSRFVNTGGVATPTRAAAGRMLGIVCVDEPDRYPYHARWAATDDLAALQRPDSEFIPADTWAEARQFLDDRYPSPAEGASRVTELHSGGESGPIIELRVHPYPILRRLPPGDPPSVIAALTTLVADAGPVLIDRGDEVKLQRMEPHYDKSDLVIARYGVYGRLRYAPEQARRRQKGRTARAKKSAEKARANQARGRASLALGQLVREVARELHHHEPMLKGLFAIDYWYGGPVQRIRQLLGLLAIRRRFVGGSGYRAWPQYRELREAYKALPEDVRDHTDWRPPAECRAFWEAELAARMPRVARPLVLPGEEDDRDAS